MHEMPDLSQMGKYWYLLTTEYSDRCKTIYRISETLHAPWKAPVDDAFDGRAYYAARSCSDGERHYLFGWVPTKENQDDLQNWQWGGTLVVHEAFQRVDGTLGMQIPTGVANAFLEGRRLIDTAVMLSSQDSSVETYLTAYTGDLFNFEAAVEFSTGTRRFGIHIFEDPVSGDACEFIFHLLENRLSFDRTPNLPWLCYLNRGLERPIRLEPARKYALQIAVDNTIATLYIDGVALNTRLYAKAGQALAVYGVDGNPTIDEAVIETGLK
jgi:beta-fructofuranosidase